MNLEEYRKKKAMSSNFVKFSDDGEIHYMRFLDEEPSLKAHLKTYDSDKKKYLYDEAIPENYDGKVSIVLRLSIVEYDQGGANPRKAVWEFSEFLYNKFAKSYIEDPDNGVIPENVWKVKATTPKDLTCSYAFIKINSTLESHPIPKSAMKEEADEEAQAPKKAAAPSVEKAAAKPAPKKTGYFD